MATSRASTNKTASPASVSADRSLCAYLARQAAREWTERPPDADRSTPPRPRFGEAVMTGGAEYLRAADIAQLTGMHIRTIRRWIAARSSPRPSSVVPGWWRRPTLTACLGHLPTKSRQTMIARKNMMVIHNYNRRPGNLHTKTRSIYFVIGCPNVTS